jgi:UDP-N-acetylglucosamine:LPS N-acetylglucosamine transferase
MYKTTLWAAWSEQERSMMSVQICRAVVRSINPHLAVFDCFPSSAMVAAVVQRKVPVVLCLREMQDLGKYLEHINDLLPHLAFVLVPHDPGAFDLPEAIQTKSCFVGQIVRPFSQREQPRRNPDRPNIVITGGGGGFGGTASFYNLAMRALVELRGEYPFLHGRLIAGPLFSEWSNLELAKGIPITPFEPDMIGAFAEADLVISAAGYNTVAELEQIGVRTILVPGQRKWDDQYSRAERLAHIHSHIRCFGGTSAIDLSRVAQELLQRTLTVPSKPAEGAHKAAAILCSMVRDCKTSV